MNVKVGPFYGGKEGDMLTIDNLEANVARKPSVELLESVKLKPTYFSFPSSGGDLSPAVPSFRFPHYGYYGIQHDHLSPIGRAIPSPKSYYGDAPTSKTTIFGTVMNSINFFVGIGILALPFAVRKSGWIGILVLPILGFLQSHTALLLGRCQYQFSLDTYPDIAEVSFGIYFRSFVTFMFYVQLLFEVTIYQVLLVQCLDLLFHPSLSHHAITWLSTGMLILLAHLFTSKGSATWLSLISCLSIAVLCMALIVAFILRYVDMYTNASFAAYRIKDNTDGEINAVLYVPSVEGVNIEMFGSPENFCRYLAIACYCFMSHAVLPSIYRNMKRPSQFPTVVKYSFLIMNVSYTLLSTMGYIAYGDAVNSNILLNVALSMTPSQHILSIVLTSTVMVTVETKYALASVPITESLYDWSLAMFYSRFERVEGGAKYNRASPESVDTYTDLTNQLHTLPSTSPYQHYDIEGVDEIDWKERDASQNRVLRETEQRILLRNRLFGSQDTAEEEETTEGDVGEATGAVEQRREGTAGPTTVGGAESLRGESTPPPGKLPTPFSLLIEEEQDPQRQPGEDMHLLQLQHQQQTHQQSHGAVSGGVKTSRHTLMIRTPTLEDILEEGNGDDVQKAEGAAAVVTVGDSTRPFFEGVFRVVVRTLLPFLSMWLAVLFPHFIILVMFMGGVLGSLISITIPAACYLRMFGSGLGFRETLWVWLIMVVGLVILGTTLGLLILVHM